MDPSLHSPMGPPPWLPSLPPISAAFWNTPNIRSAITNLHDTLDMAKAMKKELETLTELKNTDEGAEAEATEMPACRLSEFLKENGIDLAIQESFAVDVSRSIISKLSHQLEPFRVAMDEKIPWEEKSAAVKLANKIQKAKRNKSWRKRKRRHIAEIRRKERGGFDKVDQEADEWRAREIAKNIARRQVEKMKEITKLKAKEEKKRLEFEFEMVVMVEKLQELRAMRIDKLKKQGHFLPEEDDKFLERVRATVEEDERLVMAATSTDAAKDAIAIAEESRKSIYEVGPRSQTVNAEKDRIKENHDHVATDIQDDSIDISAKVPEPQESEERGSTGVFDTVLNLPMEFYHYYHGSNTDMGTLVEVRRTWDAYIRPRGSRIPGHWVQPPLPSDEVWASYLVKR